MDGQANAAEDAGRNAPDHEDAGETTVKGGDAGSGSALAGVELVLEEEGPGLCAVDGVVESVHPGFSGSGYLNTVNAIDAAIEWRVVTTEAQTVELTFTYANALEDRSAQVLVDGAASGSALSFPPTNDWTKWSSVTATLSLSDATHTIALAATTAGGLANIDRLTLRGTNLVAAACDSNVDPVVDPADGTSAITVWLAGDSTVADGLTPCPSGWGKFLADQFNDRVTVVNSAVGGRSVRTWLYEVTDQMGGDGECLVNTDGSGTPIPQARWPSMLDQMREDDYLFIQFGINDGSPTCPRHVGGLAFKREYAMMAQAALARGVQPVFLTPVSAIRCNGSTAVGSRGFLTETFDVGASENVPVIDLHRLSVELYQSLSFCPVAGGDVSASTTGPVGDFFCDDHTHFSNLGAARIAALVATAIEDAGLSLATYLN